jgi:hypothetical protein
MNMVRKAMGISVIGALAALMIVSLATAQPGGGGGGGGQGGPGGGGPGGGGGRGNFDPAQMRQMMEERFQEQLGVSAEEWKAIGPKVMKVWELNQQVAPMGRGMGRGGMGGGRGGMGGAMAGQQDTEVAKARAALSTVLENEQAKPEDITKALTAYRQARDKAKTELAAAQADLKKALTPKQEAQLVLTGQLE